MSHTIPCTGHERAKRRSPKSLSHQRPHRRLMGMECLESRTVLSAGLHQAALPANSFDLAIRGTDIQYSELGLPAAMNGDVFAGAGAASAARIGTYHESLTPILMDINGDQVPDFVGTTGTATFSFFAGNSQHVFGSITTVETSLIQGITATGQMLVGSHGTITDSTSLLRGLAGGFDSQSTVGLVPTFEMRTNVHFTVNHPVGPAFAVLAIANDLSNRIDVPASHATADQTSPTVLFPSDGGSISDHGAGHASDVQQNAKHAADSTSHDAVDLAFADDVDWRLDTSGKNPRSV
jgi:hypothetical protein